MIAITNTLSNYVDNIPNRVPAAAVKSFAIALAIEVVVVSNLNSGLFVGSVSATATLIHALITPLFKNVIGEDRALTWNEEMLRRALSYIGAASIAMACGQPRVFEALLLTTFLDGISLSDDRRRTDEAQYLIIFPNMIRKFA